MSIESGWLKIFEQKSWIFFVLFLFSIGSFFAYQGGFLIYLSKIVWSFDVIILSCILFFLLFIGSILVKFYDFIKSFQKNRRRKNIIISNLNSLSDIEKDILVYLASNNQKSFNCRIDNGDVSLLIQKGIIIRAGGYQNMLEVAHVVSEDAWHFITKPKNNFTFESNAEHPPWVRDWMSY
jgi:hypothetical protein